MSKIQLSTYINFQGRAREAMEYYHSVLGGDLILRTLGEQGVPRPAGVGDSVIYSRLDVDGTVIVGVDGNPNYPPQAGDNMAIALRGTDKERLTRAFYELAEGGKAKMPPTAQPWGGEVGWLMDKFGINWMVSIDKE